MTALSHTDALALQQSLHLQPRTYTVPGSRLTGSPPFDTYASNCICPRFVTAGRLWGVPWRPTDRQTARPMPPPRTQATPRHQQTPLQPPQLGHSSTMRRSRPHGSPLHGEAWRRRYPLGSPRHGEFRRRRPALSSGPSGPTRRHFHLPVWGLAMTKRKWTPSVAPFATRSAG